MKTLFASADEYLQNSDWKDIAVLRSCTNSRRTHLDGKFSACLCQKILKYTQYSCAFLASAVKKFARQSAHFSYWYSF